MSTPAISLPAPLTARRGRTSERVRSVVRERPELLGLLALAAVLYLWGLGRNGWANEYYSAAVRSMSTSWHAFLYGSFDSSGVMTVDKPPLAFWVQALSARVFGLSAWSILVPQALMGVATVGLTYDMVRRRFGRAAGFAGGLALALTPTAVAISRHNNPDALLVLCCVAALWFLVRGLDAERPQAYGRTKWLLLSGLCVGLGFETKMAVALMVVPGIALAWFWVAPRGRVNAVRQLLAGGAVMSVVGLAWPVLVWLTPAADRPWVSGTSDNSIWSLIFGYNGLGRIAGQSGGPGGSTGGPGGGGGGGGLFGGSTGPLRLLNEALGGQAGWLLGFGMVTVLALVAITRLRRADPRTGWLLAVGGSLVVTAVAFSFASGIFHPYYVSLLAPFIAAMVGAGVGALADGGRVMRVAGPLVVAAGLACEVKILGDNPGELGWVEPLLLVGGAAAAAVLGTGTLRRVRRGALAGVVGLLLLAPGVWAVQTLGHATSGTFPAGGPASSSLGFGGPGGAGGMRGGFGPPPGVTMGQGATGAMPMGGGGGMFGGNSQTTAQAVAYAKAHGGGTVAVSSQQGAGTAVIAGEPVVAIGGFSGRESQVSVSWLADAVAAGKIRYVLVDSTGSGGPQDSRVGAKEVMAVAAKVGVEVGSVSGLYDLQGKAAALRATA